MASKSVLKKMLESLIAEADEITQLYESSQQRLYLNLGSVYLWWREAVKVQGFLEELYAERKLVSRGEEENFTRLVRLVWQMDWSGRQAPKLQNWARALRGLNQEFKTNKDAYDVKDPEEKIRQFFDAKGGISGVGSLVTPMQNTDEQEGYVSKSKGEKKKSKQEVLSETAITAKHVEWHPKLSHFEENLHPNLSHPNRLSCLIFEQGWARSDQRGNFEQITQTCPSRQGLHPTS
jgi:hypothetical protein